MGVFAKIALLACIQILQLASVFATTTGSTLAATSSPVSTTTMPSPRDLLDGRQKPLIQATEGILNVKSNGFEVSVLTICVRCATLRSGVTRPLVHLCQVNGIPQICSDFEQILTLCSVANLTFAITFCGLTIVCSCR
jgi:hypothetical protein